MTRSPNAVETPNSETPPSILSFEDVSVPRGARFDSDIEGASFDLPPGGLLVIHLAPGGASIPLADAATGIATPSRGRVLFLGEDWAGMPPARAARLRSRIGRVFEGRGWISNLDVLENVTLAARHHTGRPVDEIRAEADALARRFSLDGIPVGRPAAVGKGILRKAEWVRAFLGGHALVLLEKPLSNVDGESAPALAEAVGEARGRGAAVVWTTEAGIPEIPDLRPSLRYRMAGAILRPEEERP
jgi:ABC-type lipoprotein export system ATPase subunit